jgi:hypothetical protein
MVCGMRKNCLNPLVRLVFIAGVLLGVVPDASALTYQVGPTRTYRQLTDVAGLLNPGDIVEVDGGATYNPVTFQRPGSAAQRIVIRGIPAGGQRPIISGSDANGYTLYLRTASVQMGYYTIESFEIANGSQACIRNMARDVIYRDIIVRDCARHGLLSHDYNSGNLTVLNSTFTRIGGTYSGENLKHPIYVTTAQDTLPGSTCHIEGTYVFGNRSGNNIKSRCERNEIYYNWLEGAEFYELEMIGPEGSGMGLPGQSDVVGNVMIGYGGYIMRLGTDGHDESRGRYRFVNNTMIAMNPGNGGGMIRHNGLVTSVEFINNIIWAGSGPARLYRIDGSWVNGAEVITGSNNWMNNNITADQSGGASVINGSRRGTNPGFTNSSSGPTFDPRLVPTADAINRGTTALGPTNAYPVPSSLGVVDRQPPYRGSGMTNRPVAGTLDQGAYEQGSATGPTPPAAPTNVRIIR